uniref:Uncharacterized protein n=1 Tax=Glossina pallidipes TaxID=7398 RepID=A0A1A9ZAN4_GLOPL
MLPVVLSTRYSVNNFLFILVDCQQYKRKTIKNVVRVYDCSKSVEQWIGLTNDVGFIKVSSSYYIVRSFEVNEVEPRINNSNITTIDHDTVGICTKDVFTNNVS